MRAISRGQHANCLHVPHGPPHRSAVPHVPDRRRRSLSPQARPTLRRKDLEPDPTAAIPKAAARLPLPLGHSLGFGGL